MYLAFYTNYGFVRQHTFCNCTIYMFGSSSHMDKT